MSDAMLRQVPWWKDEINKKIYISRTDGVCTYKPMTQFYQSIACFSELNGSWIHWWIAVIIFGSKSQEAIGGHLLPVSSPDGSVPMLKSKSLVVRPDKIWKVDLVQISTCLVEHILKLFFLDLMFIVLSLSIIWVISFISCGFSKIQRVFHLKCI